MRKFLVWSMRLLLIAFGCVAVAGAWALMSGRAWGQTPAPAQSPAGAPGLVVSPNYGEGATAVWWMRTQAPELVVLVAPTLNGAAGCYMAVNVRPPAPGVWVHNAATGEWGGAGEVCRATVEGVRVEWGGGVWLRVEFIGKWVQGAGAGKQTVWVMERGGGVEGWRRVGVWVVGKDAGGIAWVEGAPVPLPPPSIVDVTVGVERLAPGEAIPNPPRGCWWALGGLTQRPRAGSGDGGDYPGLVVPADGVTGGLTRLCVVLGNGAGLGEGGKP